MDDIDGVNKYIVIIIMSQCISKYDQGEYLNYYFMTI